MSVNNLCRLCALKFPSASLKTLQELKSEQFDALILQYLQIQITENDGYPNTACKLCCKTLYDFDQFLVKVKVAQHKLRSTFGTNSSFTDIKEETQTETSSLFLQEFQEKNVKVETSDYENNYDSMDMDHFLNDYTLNLDEKSETKSDSEEDEKEAKLKAENEKNEKLINKINHWKCYKCNIRVQNAECLEKHFKRVHETDVEYVCTECNALFNKLTEFGIHYNGHGVIRRYAAAKIRTGNPQKLKYSCEVCGKGFAKPSAYKSHKNTHLGIKRFTCEFCGKKFTLKRHKEIHKLTACLKPNAITNDDSLNLNRNYLETVDSNTSPAQPIVSEQELKSKWKCDTCGNKFYTAYILQNHQKNVHGVKNPEHICTVCDIIFDNNKQYEEHLKTTHGIVSKRKAGSMWKCDKCPKKFNHLSKYLRHTLIHTGVRRFGCKECGKKFYLKENLVGHSLTHKRAEVNEHEVQCKQCNKTCKNQYILERHLKTHIPISERYIHICDICKRKFVSAETLKTHKEQSHKYEETFICDECGKLFKSKYRLAEHTNIHKNITFSCEICSKAFNSVPALKTHKLTHMEKRVECPVCGMKFRRTGQLTRHSTIHSGKRPHECAYCHKQFRQKYALKVHMRQHTGERPYSCIECNHFFANDGNFIKHLKGRHGLQNVSIANRHRYPFDN